MPWPEAAEGPPPRWRCCRTICWRRFRATWSRCSLRRRGTRSAEQWWRGSSGARAGWGAAAIAGEGSLWSCEPHQAAMRRGTSGGCGGTASFMDSFDSPLDDSMDAPFDGAPDVDALFLGCCRDISRSCLGRGPRAAHRPGSGPTAAAAAAQQEAAAASGAAQQEHEAAAHDQAATAPRAAAAAAATAGAAGPLPSGRPLRKP